MKEQSLRPNHLGGALRTTAEQISEGEAIVFQNQRLRWRDLDRQVDSSRQSLPAGLEGEVALRGACVIPGYFENPAETRLVRDEEGWLYPGDLGTLGGDGYLTVTGRRKPMYISGGYNVFPLEIETYLNGHEGIAESACLPVPDDVMGEVDHVWVVPRRGILLTEREVRAYCRAGLARYKNPRYVTICRELPPPPSKPDR